MRKLDVYFLLLMLSTLVLQACSGGSLDGDSNTAVPKVLVNAGPDKVVDENTTVTLSGQAQGQSSELSYNWRVSPTLAITHADNTSATASFVAPTTTTVLTYRFTLEVTDSLGNKGSDTIEYQVQPINLSPLAIISATPFSTMPDNQYPAGVEVLLDARQSYDPDATSNGQAVSQYKWQQTAGEAVLSGVSTDGDTLLFTSPILDADNQLSFSLTVTDEEGAQSSDTINLNIQSAANTLPLVDAGLEHQVFAGETIILAGQASTSVSSSEPLQYRWLNDSELEPVIASPDSLQTYAVAPAVSVSQQLTFTLEVTDAVGNVVEDALTVTVRPWLNRPLNDTGISSQADASSVGSDVQLAYPGQDGQRGRDVLGANSQLQKAGRGAQGFDFTRLDSQGDEVDDPNGDWACVRDNVTGLIWEVKAPASSTGLHSSAHLYSWYLSEVEVDPSGTQTSSAASCSLTNCNTTSYVAAANAEALCNFSDWRIPTHQELASLLHYGRSAAPMIDAEYFPNTTDGLETPVWYWTSQSSADGAGGIISATAWVIDFASGNDNFLNKNLAAHIRLVRAGR